jgi:hypothetical protein
MKFVRSLQKVHKIVLNSFVRGSRELHKRAVRSFKCKINYFLSFQRADEGAYMCQINTAKAKTRLSYLNVVGKPPLL